MKIDTSSYYPKSTLDDTEVESQTESGLFAPSPVTTDDNSEAPEPEIPETQAEHAISSLSSFLSWILVPLLMPVYGMLLVFNVTILQYTPLHTKLIFILTTVGVNTVLPILLFILLKRMGVISDVALNRQRERLIPYIITIVCLLATGWWLDIRSAPLWLCMFFAGGALAGVIESIVNFKWKISAHAAGIAGLVAMLVRLMHNEFTDPSILGWLIAAILGAGLLGAARVWLGRHTVWQVLAGYVVGFCSVFFLTMLDNVL